MARTSRLKTNKHIVRRSLEKRTKAVSHVQKPRVKQKKMTDFFSPSPKSNRNKRFAVDTTVSLENQSPHSCFDSKMYETGMSPQKRGLHRKKTEPKWFCDYVLHSSSSVTPTKNKNVNTTKQILKENNVKVTTARRIYGEKIDKVMSSLIISNTKVDNENMHPPPKSVARDIHKPQRNACKKYLKYGTIPSFNDIVKSHEEFLKFKEKVACVAELQKDSPQCDKSSLPFHSDEKDDVSDRLDCKHLTREELEGVFRQHAEFVIGIGNGTIHCDRHELYMQDPFGGSEFDRSELTFNISMSAFTSKQKTLLASLVRKAFAANRLTYNNPYYFKVILPELCLKVFGQEHKLADDEAIKYLSNPLLA